MKGTLTIEYTDQHGRTIGRSERTNVHIDNAAVTSAAANAACHIHNNRDAVPRPTGFVVRFQANTKDGAR